MAAALDLVLAHTHEMAWALKTVKEQKNNSQDGYRQVQDETLIRRFSWLKDIDGECWDRPRTGHVELSRTAAVPSPYLCIFLSI